MMRGYSIGVADLGGKRMKGAHEIIDQLSPGDALAILKALAREDDQLAVRIAEKATLYLSNVDLEEVAVVLCDGLDMLQVEEVWDRAGPKRHGYVDPGEAADETVKEIVEPFLQELRKYQKLGMHVQANQMCMGLLLGLYRFERESRSEFKNWAVDAPAAFAEAVIDAWKEGVPEQAAIQEVKEFIDRELNGWVKRLQ
jgi:hypothetical protein